MTATVDRTAFPYKMKDLCDRTGLPRQVIHFYIQQGLLPEGNKTGRNMAYYSEEHMSRLLLVRKLQEESFLPLKAIRAVLDERDDDFSPGQRAILSTVKAGIPHAGAASAAVPRRVPAPGRRDAQMLNLWADIRAAGFTEDHGFSACDLAMYEEAVSALFAREVELVTSRLSHLSPGEVAAMMTRALPLINTFLSRYHTALARTCFATA